MTASHHFQSKIETRRTMLICMVLFSLFLNGCGEKKPRIYRVGILSGVDAFASVADSFIAEMTAFGYVAGKNIRYDLQKVNADPAGEKRIAEKFAADKVDLIFAFPTDPALAAKAATQGTAIPVIFSNAGIEGTNLVESLRRPGGNITGVRFPGPDQTVKRLEFLIDLAPHIKRLYLTYDVNYSLTQGVLEALRSTALSSGITLVEVPVTSVEGIRADLRSRDASDDIGMDAILIMPELLSQSPAAWSLISKFAAEHSVPIGGGAGFAADHGAVFSYAPGNLDLGRLAAPLADKVLRGSPAGTIPIVTPENYLRLNYKRAQELGLTVPDSLLRLATEILR